VHLKYLGNGDAATTMGAIEHLAVHLGEKMCEAAFTIASAIEPSLREQVNEIVALVGSNGKRKEERRCRRMNRKDL
jgi:hypothetical protein